jgi:hypothetical protein
VNRIIIKVAAMAFFSVILCMPPIFAQDPQPLRCTITMGNVDFGYIDVWETSTKEVTAIGRIECNRTPQYVMRVYVRMGIYSLGYSRQMKRFNPTTGDYFRYGLYKEDGMELVDIEPSTSYIDIAQGCFSGNTFCNFNIKGKLLHYSPETYQNLYYGSYSDLVDISLRYGSEY